MLYNQGLVQTHFARDSEVYEEMIEQILDFKRRSQEQALSATTHTVLTKCGFQMDSAVDEQVAKPSKALCHMHNAQSEKSYTNCKVKKKTMKQRQMPIHQKQCRVT